MNRNDVVQAWGRILKGKKPLLSIEVTRECPLRCPGCYAYGDQHLGGGTTLRQLNDFRGADLVRGILDLVDRLQPLHVSIVGGDPLVRYREMEQVLPELVARGIYAQIVTSAFRQIPPAWAAMERVQVVVSIDGLQPEHDARRKPATYNRILKNVEGQRITVHCTVTGLMLNSADYLARVLDFWSGQPAVEKIWFSTFTPQKGEVMPEVLTPAQRKFVVQEMLRLQPLYPKLDMRSETIAEYAQPPKSPRKCIFAQATETVSADLKTRITPCQFGGSPDCSQCGCVASMALAGVGRKQFAGVRLANYLRASNAIGGAVARMTAAIRPTPSYASRPGDELRVI